MAWDSKNYPNGCRNCGRNEISHMGLGLCARCYKKPEVNAAARDGSLIEYDFTSVPEVEETEERRPGSFGEATPLETEKKEKGGFFSDLLGFSKKDEKVEITPPLKTTEKKPSGKGRRVSAADTLSDIWTGLGGIASRLGLGAVGRTLQFQGLSAGEMLDEALNGTFVDRKLLQPAVKARGRFDLVAAIVGPPAIVFQIERNPRSAEMLIPILKSSLRNALPQMVPAMKKAVAREEKIAEAAREMWPDLPQGVDPADAMIDAIFGGGYLEAILERQAQAEAAAREQAEGVENVGEPVS